MVMNANLNDISTAQANGRINGFTLIEVMVAVLVLSFGILGIAGLQVLAQQFSTQAHFHTQATLISHDMFERMRANPAGMQSGTYHLPESKQHENCYTTAGCSTQEMAENDMYEWAGTARGSIRSKLPLGRAVVCIDSTPQDGDVADPACDNKGNIYAIKVWWRVKQDKPERVVTTAAFR